MSRTLLFLCGAIVLSGCGPMHMPMAQRFNEEEQQQIDAGWSKALTPVDRLDRNRWLDVFVGAQAYQAGVDKLSLHSEKRFAGGLVVMEIIFDRAEPNGDRFRVEVFDPAGKLVREESYYREEIEQTYKELFTPPPPVAAGEPAGLTAQRAAFEARWKEIVDLFPPAKDKDMNKEKVK